MQVEWTEGPAFAEVAETLYIRTNQIVGMMESGNDDFAVLYTVSDEERPTVYGIGLERDAEGILRAINEPKEQPEFWDELDRRMDKAMADFNMGSGSAES